MHVETRVFLQPGFYACMLVRRVVVTDQMKHFVLRCFSINLPQKRQPLFLPMPCLAVGNYRAIVSIERCEQCRGAVKSEDRDSQKSEISYKK